MKRVKFFALVVLAGLICPGGNVSCIGSRSVNMYIDESRVIKENTQRMYGANFEWGGEEKFYLKAVSGTLENNPSFTECFKDMLPFNRMAGTSANKFYWKRAVGPLASRTAIYNWGWTKVNPHGPVEWIKGTRAADSTAEYIYTVNLDDSPENAADLAEFLTGDGEINPNGGENWAKKRKEYGLEEAAEIVAWELGNEMDLCGEEQWPVEKYVQKARERIAAIRSVDENARFSCHAHTYATQLKSGWENWHRTVLRELADDIDYISVHWYYPSNDVATGEKAVKIITDDIRSITGSNRIKIIFSENACARAASNGDAGALYRRPHTLDGAMATAEFQARMMHNPEVVAANYHSVNSASWQICYMDSDTVKSSSILELFKILRAGLCGNVVESKLDGFEQGKTAEVCSAAVKTENGLNVLVVNRSHTDTCIVNLNTDKIYRLAGKGILTGASPDSDNQSGSRELDAKYEQYDGENPVFAYSAPPMSASVLYLEEIESDDETIAAAKYENAKKQVIALKDGSSGIFFGGTVRTSDGELAARIYDGVFYVPARMAAYIFGCDVSWNENATEITFGANGDRVVFGVGDEARRAINDGGYTYVSIRDIAAVYDRQVHWDARGIVMLTENGQNFAEYANRLCTDTDELL